MRRRAASWVCVIAACASVEGIKADPPLAAASPQPGAVPLAQDAPVRPARFPGFAAQLSALPSGPGMWRGQPGPPLLAVARLDPAHRQSTRWDYAVNLLAHGMGADALGVLDVMRSDDPDLGLVPAWQLARGIALSMLRRPAEALQALGGDALAANPVACMWRMRALSDTGLGAQALTQVSCARAAINTLPGRLRAPFILAASRAAIDAGRPAAAITWLALVNDADPTANLYRAKASMALRDWPEATQRLDRAAQTGSAEIKADAQMATIEAGVAAGTLPAPLALRQLDQLGFRWRGGAIEERGLRLAAQLGTQTHDVRASLAAGAILFRYFNLGAQAAPLLAGLQAQLTSALAPESRMPVSEAAGLYWNYRDLAPSGAEGDQLVSKLADRLQSAGLYARAAQLLQYQLTARTTDVAQGPLSTKVASLYIIAGNPELALKIIRDTNSYPYPADITWDRRRVEAAALQLLGKPAEALAALQDVPDAQPLRAEIYWKQHDWAALVAVGKDSLPLSSALSDVEQTAILRHAIALAMLGQEAQLSQLRARYLPSFARLPSAGAFDILTKSASAIDPAAIERAMGSLPSASPAGAIGDLFNAGAAQAHVS